MCVLPAPVFLPQNIPTLGTVAITMALHNCDEVAVAGFGYDMNKPYAPLHYYESVKMSAIKEVSVRTSALISLQGNPALEALFKISLNEMRNDVGSFLMRTIYSSCSLPFGHSRITKVTTVDFD